MQAIDCLFFLAWNRNRVTSNANNFCLLSYFGSYMQILIPMKTLFEKFTNKLIFMCTLKKRSSL